MSEKLTTLIKDANLISAGNWSCNSCLQIQKLAGMFATLAADFIELNDKFERLKKVALEEDSLDQE